MVRRLRRRPRRGRGLRRRHGRSSTYTATRTATTATGWRPRTAESGQLLARRGDRPHRRCRAQLPGCVEDADNDGVLDPAKTSTATATSIQIANSAVIGLCQNYNNYIWIAHPNGEWSKYTHMATGTHHRRARQPRRSATPCSSGRRSESKPTSDSPAAATSTTRSPYPTDADRHTPFQGPSFPARSRAAARPRRPTGTLGYYAGGFIQGTNLAPFGVRHPWQPLRRQHRRARATTPSRRTRARTPRRRPTAGGPYVGR